MDSLLSEDQYVRTGDENKSPSTKVKRGPVSLATVEPLILNNGMTMEMSEKSGKNVKSGRHFLHQLSIGKGASLFEMEKDKFLQAEGNTLMDRDSLNETDKEGFTMLHHAARCNKTDVVANLLDVGADIDVLSNNGYTPLHIAVRVCCMEAVRVLLQRGSDPSIPNENQDTPLHFAARRGCTDMVSILLKDPRASVNCPNAVNVTPFHMACKSGNRSLCEMMLSHGADVMAKSSGLMTSLHFAALYGNVEVSELLISKVSQRSSSLKKYLDATDIEGSTALHRSCLKGFKGVAELLLRHGAEYETVTSINGSTPLHLTAMHGHVELTELLITHGAFIDSRNSHLQTPLHVAARYNQPRTSEVLIEEGADKEATDMMDLTPFLVAVVHGAKESAELLLSRGSNLVAVDAVSNSCLHLAVQHGLVEIVEMLLKRDKEKLMPLRNKDLKSVLHLAAAREDAKILAIVLGESFEPDQRDINERIPLHIAAESGSLQCVDSLLQCKTLLIYGNDTDDHGMTPLHLAARNKHTETCRLLISNGGNVAAHDDNSRTPLHLAAKAGSLKTVKLLLNSMLPNTLEEKDNDHNTALHVACMHNRLDVLRFLLDQGADVAARNSRDMTCLDVAIEWEAREVAEALVKHKRWREVVYVSSKDKIPPMEKLIQELPDVAEIVLEQCITRSPLPTSHPDFTVSLDFYPLDGGVSDAGCYIFFGPASMATYNRENLLNHCVTQALLRWKWAVLGKFITLFNFLLFSIFVVLFTILIVEHRDITRLSFGGADATQTVVSDSMKRISIVIFMFLIWELANEIFQMFWLQLSYFKDYSNIVDLCLYTSVMVYVLPFVTKDDLYGYPQVQWTAGTVGLLLAYLSLLLSFRRVSGGWIALYVTMYVEVLVTFMKVISIFTTVLIGYTLVFYILLKEEDNFSSFWMSLVKVFVMMVGEMDYSGMLSENVVNNNKVPGTNIPYVPLPEPSYIMFLLFVLTVSVILMNLLVGLAVGDIDSIQKTASLRTLVDQAILVEKIQSKYPKWLLRRAYRRSLEFKLNQNSYLKRLVFAGSGLTDQEFLGSLRTPVCNGKQDEEDDLDNYDHNRRQNQDEILKTLQSTVKEQSELLRVIAERLQITQ